MALDQHGLHGSQDLQEEVLVELLEQLACDLGLEEDWSGAFRGLGLAVKVEGHSDHGAGVEGEVELGGLHGLSEMVDVLLQGGGDTELLLDLLGDVLEQPLAEILTPQLVVS